MTGPLRGGLTALPIGQEPLTNRPTAGVWQSLLRIIRWPVAHVAQESQQHLRGRVVRQSKVGIE